MNIISILFSGGICKDDHVKPCLFIDFRCYIFVSSIIGRQRACCQNRISDNDGMWCVKSTNMDSAQGGVNFKIAEKLGMRNVQVLESQPPHAGYDAPSGLGVIGEVDPIDAIPFLKRVKEVFEVAAVRYSGDTDRQVSRIALCGGAGAFLMKKALELRADVFITGDMKYHDFMGYENRIILADIGHYESEHFTKEIFYEIITKKNPTFAVDFAKNEKNQIKYL